MFNMEKSMVRQFNGLTGSQFAVNRSTFISTAFNDGDDELRKSRIHNIPFHRKEDLSNRLPFVVVFQTIQIERLSEQVQALRVALKDSQRQQFNIQNYEIQIRELTEKCYAYEAEREEYREEIDKLNLICERLYGDLQTMKAQYEDIDPTIKQKYQLEKDRSRQLEEEVEKWRVRYSALENSKNREMEDMRLMMESQRKSMLDREIRQLTTRYESQRKGLEKEIWKLRETVDQRDSNLQRLSAQLAKSQVHIQELQRYEEMVMDYQNKFAMISQEAVRLNDLLRNKNEEIDRMSANEAQLRRRIQQLEYLLKEAEQGGEKARQLENQIREWRTKYSRIEEQNKDYKRQIGRIPEFQLVIQQINNESQKLKDAVRQKIGEIDDWRTRYHRIQGEFRQSKEQQEQRIPVFQNKIAQLNSENNRLNDGLRSRAMEIENWKNKCAEAERKANRLDAVEQEKRKLEERIDSTVRENNQLQNRTRQLEGEINRLAGIQQELHKQKSAKQDLLRETERLNGAVQAALQKSEDYRRRCENLQRQLQTFTQLQEQITIYKQKQSTLTREIDRINGIIVQKIREIQALKQTFTKYQTKMNQYQGLEKKLMESVSHTQKLIHDLDQSRKEAMFLQDKLMNADSEMRKLKNEVMVINQERDQTVRILNSKNQQLEQIRAEIDKLQGQLNILKQKQNKYREIQDKFRNLQAKFADQERRFIKQQERMKSMNMELEAKTIELEKIKRDGMMSPQFKEEFVSLKMSNENKQREIKNLQQRISNAEGIIVRLKQTVMRNDQLSKRNHQKWVSVSKQLDAYFETFRKISEMQGEIVRLNEENMQLEGNFRVLKVEADGMKKSMMDTQRMGSERDLGLSSVSSYTSTMRVENNFRDGFSPRGRNALSPMAGLQFGNRSYI